MNSQSEAGMFAEERKRQILTYVNKNMRVTVGDLCEEFSVSPATIRNDLNELHEKGLIKRDRKSTRLRLRTLRRILNR